MNQDKNLTIDIETLKADTVKKSLMACMRLLVL